MALLTVPTRPIDGQRPGTSGLHQELAVFMGPGYLENFAQSIFPSLEGVARRTQAPGGDGRYMILGRRFGRHACSRHDCEGVDEGAAQGLIARLRERLGALPGQRVQALVVTQADEFACTDPVAGSRTSGQGLRVRFDGCGRIVYRLSGTVTDGATLRVCLERLEPDAARHAIRTQAALSPLIAAAEALAGIRAATARARPAVIT